MSVPNVEAPFVLVSGEKDRARAAGVIEARIKEIERRIGGGYDDFLRGRAGEGEAETEERMAEYLALEKQLAALYDRSWALYGNKPVVMDTRTGNCATLREWIAIRKERVS